MATKKLDYEGLQTLVTVVKDYVRKHAGIPIGHEYFSVNPNIPEGSLPLFGGEYSRETYSDLWSWVQTQTGYLKTEADWQEISSAHEGNVPFYSDGDGSTTFRVPSLKCWVKSANGTINEVGSYLQAGLPNITGGFISSYYGANNGTFSEGAVRGTMSGNYVSVAFDTSSANRDRLSSTAFEANKSNSIYGNSSTVQPQSIVGLWLVKAYGTVIETGSIDEKQYIDDRLSNYLPLTGGTIDGQILLKSPTDRNVGFMLTSIDPTSTDYYRGNLDIGWDYWNRDGAGFYIRSSDWPDGPGDFGAYARNATQNCELKGKPDGTLTWGGHEVERISAKGTNYIRYENGVQIVFDTFNIHYTGSDGSTGMADYSYYKTRQFIGYYFPVAFSKAPFATLSFSDSINYWDIGVNTVDTTSIYGCVMGDNNGYKDVRVFAIGYWK